MRQGVAPKDRRHCCGTAGRLEDDQKDWNGNVTEPEDCTNCSGVRLSPDPGSNWPGRHRVDYGAKGTGDSRGQDGTIRAGIHKERYVDTLVAQRREFQRSIHKRTAYSMGTPEVAPNHGLNN
jgi:hypothetical protein